MKTYCVSCKKNTENENLSVTKTNAFIKLCCLWKEKLNFY